MNALLPVDADFVAWNDLDDRDRGFFCFADEYLSLPDTHAAQIRLATHASKTALGRWVDSSLPAGWSADNLKFNHSERFDLAHDHWNDDDGIQSVRQWLHDRHVPYATTVYLFYDSGRVVELPWKLVVRYWNALAWSVGYAMIATDATASWGCVFHHENVILFGSHADNRA